MENYRRLIHDEVFWLAVKNTIVYSLAAVTANIVITLFLAELISVLPSKWMKTMFRTILFIPCIAPMVGTSTVWKYGILGTDGGYNVVLFTAGLEGVPREFDEAAAIDGAGPVKRFLWIKLPLIGRTFAFVAIMTMANYFQMFAQFRVFAANGGRNNTAMVLTNYVFKMSFDSFDMGYASAVAAALFVLVFLVAMVQNKLMRSDWSYE